MSVPCGWSTDHAITTLLWRSRQQRLISDANPASLLSLLFQYIATAANIHSLTLFAQAHKCKSVLNFMPIKMIILPFFAVFSANVTLASRKSSRYDSDACSDKEIT
jgi:hypothetical protein